MQKITVKAVVWTVVGIVAIAAVVWYVTHPPGQGGQSGNQPAAPASTTPVYAPTGQVIAGFPKQLILDPAAALTNSYSISYSATTNQYTAQWNSSSSMTSLYAAYKQYLQANGWTITNDMTKYPAMRGLYAKNASSDVNVGIMAKGKGSQVVVTYLAK